MRVFGRAAVSDFLGDRIVYRSLEPQDPRLPPLDRLKAEIGLEAGQAPRKTEPAYARLVAHLLQAARAQDLPGTRLERLIFLGDTRLLDATAFSNLCQAGEWPGMAFIGSEDARPPQVETEQAAADQVLFLANRWSALVEFGAFCQGQGFVVDEATAVLIDLDKTAIGARGRNAKVIDRARVQAVRNTVAGLLGEAFDPVSFQADYDLLIRPEFHSFTADNQDYVAYICLVLGSGLYDLETVAEGVRSGRLAAFEQFIRQVDGRAAELPPELAEIHRTIYARVQAGDPTPFKTFRRNEYLTTIGKMGFMADDTPVETLLAEEILVTQEVREMALEWRQQGALLFGLSDKPDEASVPTAEQASQGCKPIHRTETHAVGE